MRKFIHNHTDSEIKSIFEEVMRLQGLVFDNSDSPIIMDGKTRYVKTSNRKSSKKNARSGWYVGHLGDFPVGNFGWMHGENPKFSWNLYNHLKDRGETGIEFKELTPEEIEADRIKKEREAKLKKQREKEEFDFSKALTIIEWTRSHKLNKNHNYLISKKFDYKDCTEARLYNRKNFTKAEIIDTLNKYFPEYNTARNISKLLNYQTEHITFRGDNLILKGMLIDGTPIMFQLIFNKKNKAGKNKHFPKMLKKRKSFLPLGAKFGSHSKYVIICEGWATAKSISKFTNGKISVFVGWDSGNIVEVAKEIRRVCPNIKIYIASDNDHLSPPEKNAGILSAKKTAKAVGAYMLPPPFNSENPSHAKLSDWNDVELDLGLHGATQVFRESFKYSEYLDAWYEENRPIFGEITEVVDYSSLVDTCYYEKDFQIFFMSAVSEILLGLQNIELTKEQKIKKVLDRQDELKANFLNIPVPFNDDNNKAIALVQNAIFKFTNITHIDSGFNPLSDTKNFSDVLNIIKNNPVFNNELQLVYQAFEHIHPPVINNAIMIKQLENNNFFPNNQSEWQEKVCIQLSKNTQSKNFHLAQIIPYLIQSREVLFWQGTNEEERLNMAVDQIISEIETNNDQKNIDNINEIQKNYAMVKKVDELLINLYAERNSENQQLLDNSLEFFNTNNNLNISEIIINKIKLFMIILFKKA